MRHAAFCVLGIALCLALVGCSDGQGSVSGTVTFDDQPVANGAIKFVPADGKGNPAGGVITDGRYTVKLPPGKYKVEVSAQKKTGTRTQKGFDGKDEVIDLTEEMIPEWYNTKSELVEEIGPGSRTLDLKLKSTK